ncbi:hypothetical protein TNCT_661631 [Trichonephila clavata]|uniref:Uncharacterized protein n=1 Tax=Trichonephila clavata TaxID=2740835 RepID=A0A8X6GJ92_TRICU|nr:hypothetical protein TNCT_661631 [Trichonephila clavata]
MIEIFHRSKLNQFLGDHEKQKSGSNKTETQFTLRGVCWAFWESCFLDVFSLCEETSPGPQRKSPVSSPCGFFSLGTLQGVSVQTSPYNPARTK